MRLSRLVGTLAVLGLSAAPLSAQVGTFKFLSGSSTSAFGVSVGTYKAQLDGKAIDVWCVDFLNHVAVGNQYQVNITSLGGTPDLSNTRFGSLSNQPDIYRQTAWLASQFALQPTSNWGFIHAAIWSLTSPGSPNVTGASNISNVNYWLGQAASNYNHYKYDNAYVLSDVAIEGCALANPTGGPWNGCGHQEHLYFTGQLTVTPEPATMMLLATGLVGLGGVTAVRRRRRAKG